MLKKLDKTTLFCLFCFLGISLLSILSASTYLPSYENSLVLRQLLWYLLGFGIIFLLFKTGNDFIIRHSFFLYLCGNLLLLLLLLFADPINNSKCWFVLPGIGSFQPSEFMKLILIITLAKLFRDFKKKYPKPNLKQEFVLIIKSFLLVLIPSILTFLEPDTGVVLIYFVIYFVMLFLSGIRLRWFFFLFLGIVFLLGTLSYLYFFEEELFLQILGTKMFYRIDRIFAWQKGTGLQLENAMAAIGSSGLLGHGFNQTPIYFPESGTDFIFAVFASNFGLLGSILFILILLLFDLRLLFLSQKNLPHWDKFFLIGVTSMLFYQQVQNISMTLGLMPITGITLPFISYGGSSLLSYMILLGIVFNIAKERT